MALTACSVGPRYRRPDTVVPSAFVAPSPSAPEVSPAWWHRFGAPELDRLIEQAHTGNLDIQVAIARVFQADQAARVAGSPLLPGVTADASQNWQRTGNAGSGLAGLAAPGSSHYTETRTYTGEFSASYELDFWGRNRDALQAAQAQARASRFNVETVRLTTEASIATTYFQALEQRDRLAIAEHNLVDAQQVLDAFRGRLDVGVATALDLSQQEALVAGYRAQIPALRSLYRQQVLALGLLVGEPPEAVVLNPVPLAELHLPPVGAGLPSDLLRRRPDIANAEALLMAQNFTVKQDVANFFPQLQLTAAGGVSALALSALTGPGSLIASLGSSLTQTVFDNGAKSGTLGQAKGLYREYAADYARAVLQALTDVETALTQLDGDTEQQRLEGEAVATAQRSADIARAQMQAGTVDIVTVLNTETTLFSDQDTLVQVRAARFLALVSLYKALGGGWVLPEHGG